MLVESHPETPGPDIVSDQPKPLATKADHRLHLQPIFLGQDGVCFLHSSFSFMQSWHSESFWLHVLDRGGESHVG